MPKLGTLNRDNETVTPSDLQGTSTPGVMVSFVDDGNYPETENYFTAYLQAQGEVGCIAVTTPSSTSVGTGHTAAELVTLEGEGFEVVGHSVTHPDMRTLTDAELDDELRLNKEWLTGLGLTVENFAYPIGYNDERVRAATRTYYNSGIGVAQDVPDPTGYKSAVLSIPPLTTYHLKRPDFNRMTLEEAKLYVDAAISEGDCWLIFLTHSIYARPEYAGEPYEFLPANFDGIIDYIQSNNVPIVNCKTGIATIGNAIDFGDYQALDQVDPGHMTKFDESPHMVVGCNGASSIAPAMNDEILDVPKGYNPIGAHDNASPPSTWKNGKISWENYNGTDMVAKGFPTALAGTLVTSRISNTAGNPSGDGWQYQEIYEYGTQHFWRRASAPTDAWGDWKYFTGDDANFELIGEATNSALDLGTFTAGETKTFDILPSNSGDIDLNDMVDVTISRHPEGGLIASGYVYSADGTVRVQVTSIPAQTVDAHDYIVRVFEGQL